MFLVWYGLFSHSRCAPLCTPYLSFEEKPLVSLSCFCVLPGRPCISHHLSSFFSSGYHILTNIVAFRLVCAVNVPRLSCPVRCSISAGGTVPKRVLTEAKWTYRTEEHVHRARSIAAVVRSGANASRVQNGNAKRSASAISRC